MGDSSAQTAREAALMRAARSLNESLDLNRVLVRICEEAARVLGADYANVFLGNATDGLRLEATYGLPADLIGTRVEAGEGLVGKAIERDRPMLTNDYQALPRQVSHPQFERVRSSLAVPMHWEGQLRGGLAVGYFHDEEVSRDQLTLLEAFGDLAAAACRNASAHAGLALAARTDALTGCLNHAALHDALRRELERCRRTGHGLSLVIVDLDDFKHVNEMHGHLAGDEVLRRVGQSLRDTVRTYDLVARYGGDEFVVVALDADERTAVDVATRSVEGIAARLSSLEFATDATAATAGVAEWQPGDSPNALIARADRALRYGKQRGARGTSVRASTLPEDFVAVGNLREDAGLPEADDPIWHDRARDQTERLRRRTRQLAVASAVAERLSNLSDPRAIAEAVVDELDRGFEHFLAAVLRLREDGHVESVAVRGVAFERLGIDGWAQSVDSGLIGRAVRGRGPVVCGDVHSEPEYMNVPEMVDVRSEIVVPVLLGDAVWGVIDIEEVRGDAFDEDDVRLLQTVAAQLGLALRAAGVAQAAADSESSSARQSRSTLAT
jgi:diguanylate cyclase (GGDEF)-like protein